eukprot:s1529_g10.t1
MDATTAKYATWLQADPLTRLKTSAPDNGGLSAGFERLDQRVTSLLLQAVPKAIKSELIATHELTSAAIMFRVLRTFQPGGLVEKSRLLEDLTTIQKGTKDSPAQQVDGKKDENKPAGGNTVDEDVKKGEAAMASSGGGAGGGKKPESLGNSNTNELLHEATKLLKSLQIPSAKMITLQELGDPLQGSSELMLLDSGATHTLRRAKSWTEWEEAEKTVVALAQGTTSSLRIKPGSEVMDGVGRS